MALSNIPNEGRTPDVKSPLARSSSKMAAAIGMVAAMTAMTARSGAATAEPAARAVSTLAAPSASRNAGSDRSVGLPAAVTPVAAPAPVVAPPSAPTPVVLEQPTPAPLPPVAAPMAPEVEAEADMSDYWTVGAGYNPYNSTGKQSIGAGARYMHPASDRISLGGGLDIGGNINEAMTVIGFDGNMHSASGSSAYIRPAFTAAIHKDTHEGFTAQAELGLNVRKELDQIFPSGIEYHGGKSISPDVTLAGGYTFKLTEKFGLRLLAALGAAIHSPVKQGSAEPTTDIHAGINVDLLIHPESD